MKPIIGLSTYFVEAFEFGKERIRGMRDQDMFMASIDYSNTIYAAGGIPVSIAPIDEEEYLEAVVDQIDGLLLTGGGDVNPKLYNQPFKKGLGALESRRDTVEMKLLELAMKRDIPIFGICRGFQLMNVYFGGTLIQDIGTYYETYIEHVGTAGPKSSFVHQVEFPEDSHFKSCFESDMIQVNSIHHQMIDQLGEQLISCGLSEDGIVEAFAHRERPHVFAVQWHPEMMADEHEEQLRIFELFIHFSANRQLQDSKICSDCF